jgi:predicted PhzF superfamily epimerase YddE/YHI9
MVFNGKESVLCGHGTLAAAKVLFTQLGPGQENVDTIHFRCVSGVAIQRDDGFIEIPISFWCAGECQQRRGDLTQ